MALPTQTASAPILDSDYYPAVCVGATCLGHIDGEYQGKPNCQLKVIWTFELLSQDYEVGGETKPRLFGLTLNHRVSKPGAEKQSKIWEYLESWRDEPLDLSARQNFDSNAVVGDYARLSIAKVFKDGEAKNKIDGIKPYKGKEFEPQTMPWSYDITAITDLETAELGMEQFPDWQKENIHSSREYQALLNA